MSHDYEAIGRYHVAVQDVRRLIGERNDLLGRVGLVLRNSGEMPPGGALGKRCNFDAVQKLLDQARAIDEGLQSTVALINELAPLANLDEVRLA